MLAPSILILLGLTYFGSASIQADIDGRGISKEEDGRGGAVNAFEDSEIKSSTSLSDNTDSSSSVHDSEWEIVGSEGYKNKDGRKSDRLIEGNKKWRTFLRNISYKFYVLMSQMKGKTESFGRQLTDVGGKSTNNLATLTPYMQQIISAKAKVDRFLSFENWLKISMLHIYSDLQNARLVPVSSFSQTSKKKTNKSKKTKNQILREYAFRRLSNCFTQFFSSQRSNEDDQAIDSKTISYMIVLCVEFFLPLVLSGTLEYITIDNNALVNLIFFCWFLRFAMRKFMMEVYLLFMMQISVDLDVQSLLPPDEYDGHISALTRLIISNVSSQRFVKLLWNTLRIYHYDEWEIATDYVITFVYQSELIPVCWKPRWQSVFYKNELMDLVKTWKNCLEFLYMTIAIPWCLSSRSGGNEHILVWHRMMFYFIFPMLEWILTAMGAERVNLWIHQIENLIASCVSKDYPENQNNHPANHIDDLRSPYKNFASQLMSFCQFIWDIICNGIKKFFTPIDQTENLRTCSFWLKRTMTIVSLLMLEIILNFDFVKLLNKSYEWNQIYKSSSIIWVFFRSLLMRIVIFIQFLQSLLLMMTRQFEFELLQYLVRNPRKQDVNQFMINLKEFIALQIGSFTSILLMRIDGATMIGIFSNLWKMSFYNEMEIFAACTLSLMPHHLNRLRWWESRNEKIQMRNENNKTLKSYLMYAVFSVFVYSLYYKLSTRKMKINYGSWLVELFIRVVFWGYPVGCWMFWNLVPAVSECLVANGIRIDLIFDNLVVIIYNYLLPTIQQVTRQFWEPIKLMKNISSKVSAIVENFLNIGRDN